MTRFLIYSLLCSLGLFQGCLPTMSASITGVISDIDDNIVPNAAIEIRAWDGEILEELNTDTLGEFSVSVPPYQTFFVIASSDEHPKTAFTGYSGEGEYKVPNGTLWLRTNETVNTAFSEFSGCSIESDSTTGSIEGQALLYIEGTPVTDLPTLTTATVTATQDESTYYDGCYLPSVDEDTLETEVSTQTGESGRYALQGLPNGVTTIEVTINVEGELYTYPYVVYVPEGGLAPLLPTLVPFLELP